MAYKVTDFKVGDLVRVRDWDDMAKEFGFSDLYINVTCGCVFNPKMKVFCGQEFVITVIEEDSKGFWEIKGHNFNGWTITPEMIEPVNRETKEVKQMKNYSEAIEYMQQEKLKQTEPFQKFYDDAIEAMKRLSPRDPDIVDAYIVCPTCGKRDGLRLWSDIERGEGFCDYCGQHMAWNVIGGEQVDG